MESADPAPAAVQACFPSITHRVDNWRAFNPETLTVCPFPEMPITFKRVSIKEDSSLTGGHYTTWVGRSAAMPGASLVTVGTKSGYDVILEVPGNGEMNIHISGAGDDPKEVLTSISDSTEAGCGIDSIPARPNPDHQTVGLYAAKYRAAAEKVQLSTADIVSAEGAPTVDLLFLYESSMLDYVKTKTSGDPVAYLDGQLKVVTATINVFLTQSGITTFTYRYIGLLASPAYSRSGHLQEDLDAMAPNGAIGAWLMKTRYDLGADEVCLLVGTSQDYGGIANFTEQRPPPASYKASCVVSSGAWATINSVNTIVVAHEIAHTMGCTHDRGTAHVPNDDKYCYGWITTATSTSGGVSFTSSIGTIMAQTNARIPYFSNPNLSLDIYYELYDPQFPSTPVGIPPNMDFGTFTIGVPTSATNAQYNAKVLADNGPVAASLMDPITLPAITQQPSPTTSVAAGQELKLSVAATGGGLYYQWKKDGAAIAGATDATFTQSSSATANAGDYTVMVNNSLGTATSNKATVTITAAPATTPTPTPTPTATPSSSGGGGGGGGGGAPSLWFTCLLALLGIARKGLPRARY